VQILDNDAKNMSRPSLGSVNLSNKFTWFIVAQQGRIHKDLVNKSMIYNLFKFGNETVEKV